MPTLDELMAEKQRRQQSGNISLLLAEKQRRQQMQGQDQGFAERLAGSPPVQFTLGAGDSLSNMMSAAKSTIFGGRYNPIQTGEGLSYDVGRFAGNVAPFLIPGPHTATVPARLATSAAAGALFSPENPMEGAGQGAIFGAIGETLPPIAGAVGKGFKWAGDKFSRNEYSKNLMKSMSDHFKRSQKEAMGYLNPLLNKFGKEELPLEQASLFIDAAEDGKQYLSSKIKNIYKNFSKEPTIENAQKLQSQIGAGIRDIKGVSASDIQTKEYLVELRNSLIDSMKTKFDEIGGDASENYDKFRKIYATETSVYQNNPVLNRIVHGETTGITPKKLDTALQKAIEGTRSKVPEIHEIRPMAEELGQKLDRSSLYSSAVGGGIGMAAGGPYGGLIGAALPKALSIFKPDIAGTLLNEELGRLLGKAGSTIYPSIRQAATGMAVAPDSLEGNK
jgi:hypothetical protein